MDYFSTAEWGRTFVLRLDQGDDVLESINQLLIKENIKDGIVVSGIGSLDACIIHMVTTTAAPFEEYFKRWSNQPLELASVDGFIADGQPHLHMVVSDTQTACAGHMEKGCRVLCLAEIVIVELKPMNLTRVPDHRGVSSLTTKNN